MIQALDVHDLAIGFPKKGGPIVVADQIRLTIGKGRLVGLIGSNGAGKSTLLRTLSGLQTPLQGQILLDGQRLSELDALHLACHRSVVLTESLPVSDLTVFELVALGRQPYTNWLGRMTEADLTATHDALKMTGVEALASKRYYEISDGQLQNVMIARALAQQTPLIFLDEPTTHLDLPHKLALLQLLRRLVSEAGKTIIFSTHDIEQAVAVCDDFITMMPSGVLQATREELLQNGILDALFASSGLRFDAERLRFVARES